jgi:hypothetical protein
MTALIIVGVALKDPPLRHADKVPVESEATPSGHSKRAPETHSERA